MLNPVHLRTLATVVREGSFAAGAARLGYTASAVSQQMAALEQSSRLRLFERSARAIIPTPAAHDLVRRAGEALAALDALDDDVRAMVGGTVGTLRLGSFPTASLHVLPAALATLSRSHPDLAVTLDEGEPDALVPLVRDRQLDLALAYQYDLVPPRWSRDVARTALLSEELVLLRPATHRAAEADVRLGELKDAAWIATAVGTAGSEMIHRACARAGFVPTVRHRTNDYGVVRELVAAGLGIALVPALGHEETAGVVSVRVTDLDVRRTVVAVHRRIGAHPAVPAALDALIGSARGVRGRPVEVVVVR